MRQPWLLKAIAFQCLRWLPPSFYDWLTVVVTGRGRRQILRRALENSDWHASALAAEIDIRNDVVLEFGAGKDLLNNLLLFRKGFRRQITVDIQELVRPYFLNNLLGQYPVSELSLPPFGEDFRLRLSILGIDYRAPCDMRATGLPAGSVAAVTSTNTLEHIPTGDIERIMVEIFRILRPAGVCSFKIDYTDHYSHTDSKIDVYNFLQFRAGAWRILSPPNHYQNRMRHVDYVHLFESAGFIISVAQTFRSPDWLSRLSRINPAAEFQKFTPDELSITAGWFLLRKP
jgi:hypothetical protein